MPSEANLSPLFDAAHRQDFAAFRRLFETLEGQLSPADFAEAYLLRAQIKLYASDATLLQDLAKAQQNGAKPQFAFLCGQWKCDALNRFVVFPLQQGALQAFLQALPAAHQAFALHYGQPGAGAVQQIESEIYYFMGDAETALQLSQQRSAHPATRKVEKMQALILQYRCHLALGQTQKAQEVMIEIIGLSKRHPECVESYQAFRAWANLTTGWGGDSPRFQSNANGERQPDFSDRLRGIKQGIGRDTPLEAPFVQQAKCSFGKACSLRELYMELFNTLYWQSTQDDENMQLHIHRVQNVVNATGLMMPLIESGEQIMPLLRYLEAEQPGEVTCWHATLSQRAAQYESYLAAYRLTNE